MTEERKIIWIEHWSELLSWNKILDFDCEGCVDGTDEVQNARVGEDI